MRHNAAAGNPEGGGLRIPMKLSYKFFIFFLVLLTVTMVVTGFFAGKAVSKTVTEQLSARLSGGIAEVGQPLKSAFAAGKEDALLSVLQKLQRQSGALYAAAVTLDGLVLAHTNVAKSGEMISDPETLKALKSGKTVLTRSVYRAEPALEILTPFNWAGDISGEEMLLQSAAPAAPLGTIMAAMPLAEANKAEREITLRLFLVIFSVYLISLATAALFLHVIRRQVLLLEETIAGAVPEGKSGPLAEILNSMKEKLFAVSAPANFLAVRRSAEALQKSEQLLAATLRSIGDGVIICDAAGKIVSLNDAAQKLTGWSGDAARGRPIAEVFRVINAATRKAAEVPVARALREDRVVGVDDRTALNSRDGVERLISDSCAPIHDTAGAVIGAVLVFRDISEEFLRREQLRVSEERLQNLIEQSPLGIQILDAGGKTLQVNRAFEMLRGATLEQMRGYDLFEDDQFKDSGAMSCLKKAYLGEFVELPILEFSPGPSSVAENKRVVQGIAYPIRDKAGAIREVTLLYQDITERQKSEREKEKLDAALRESETRLRFAQESSGIGAWDLDLTDRTVFHSIQHDRIFGYSELQPKWSDEMFLGHLLPEERPRINEKFRRAIAEKGLFNAECRIRRADGEVRWIWVIARLQLEASGAARRMAGIVQDITERKRTEEALRLANSYNRNLLEASLDPLVTIGSDGRITDANAAVETITGRPRSEIIGTDFSDYFTDPERARAGYERAFREGKILNYPLDCVGRDGRVTPVLYNAAVYRDGSGKAVGVFAAARDITGLRQAEQEKEKLNAALIEKNRDMESFLYITTHDLRGPLVNIQGFTQNLERYIKELRAAQAELTPQAKEKLDKLAGDSIPKALKFVLDSAHKMDSMITALLKVSRIGQVEMKPETLEMNEVLQKIVASMRYQLEEAGGEIKCGRLPPCKADPGAISQLFANLLGNAVKYRSGDRPLMVSISGDIKADTVIYAVADNGSGIPEADLKSIGNLFYRSANASGKIGEGIGLHMVKRIAEKNGGAIRVESKEGRGSVFYVELPAAEGGVKWSAAITA